MALPTDALAAGDEAAPVLVQLAAGDVGARAPGERLEVPSKGTTLLAFVLLAFAAVAVIAVTLPEPALRIAIAYGFSLLLRALIALLATGGFTVAFTLFVVVSFTVLTGRLRAVERHRFRWL